MICSANRHAWPFVEIPSSEQESPIHEPARRRWAQQGMYSGYVPPPAPPQHQIEGAGFSAVVENDDADYDPELEHMLAAQDRSVPTDPRN
jgi:hypothetical protein